MEEDIHDFSTSSIPPLGNVAKKRLEEAVAIAEERIDFDTAHNVEIQRALEVVRAFLKRKGRVCYGGTAMNELLPDDKKFYNPETDLPDYDFFTPTLAADVAELVADFQAAGFKDIYHKVGMHEGTEKVMVNFVPVADVSAIDEDLYNVFHKRAIRKGGIYYTDPDILRMMMYLEISRPRGEVSRWPKVYERLELINSMFPVKVGARSNCWTKRAGMPERGRKAPVDQDIRRKILDFVIEQQRILCNGPVEDIYRRGILKGDAIYLDRPGGLLFFTSPEPEADARHLREILGPRDKIRLLLHRARGQLVPARIEIRLRGRPVAMILEEDACHSYHSLPFEDGRILLVASPEFLITLYTSLALFTKHSDLLTEGRGSNLMCRVRDLVAISRQNITARRSQFPAFPVTCKGYQRGYATLLKAKIRRIRQEKEGSRYTSKGSSAGRTKSRKVKRDQR